MTTAGVIGAGIQGIGIALELAARGIAVDLHERSAEVHGRASLVNEGKIHLGYIYAKDPTLRTASQMVEGAWAFSRIVEGWLERPLDGSFRSSPFHYLVHRESLVPAGTLERMYARIAALNESMAIRPGSAYFGLRGARPPRALSPAERSRRFGPDVVAAYATPEIAVDTHRIATALRRRVAEEPLITLRLGSEVIAAVPDDRHVTLRFVTGGRTETQAYDHVVNASWEDLLRIDATAGLPAPPGSSFRLRRVLRIPAETAARAVDSCSIVLGAFGDVVRFANGDVFLSWYPVGRRAMTTSIRPPTGWQAPPSPGETAEIASVTLRALRELVPALDPFAAIAVGPSMIHSGVIYARGTSDIHDPRSGYHERYAIGPRSSGRYHSIDTGKYTTAPLFACRIADRIAGPRRTLMTFGAATPRTGATPPAANTPWVAGPAT